MKTIAPRKSGRAGAAGKRLALESFTSVSFDGISITTPREREAEPKPSGTRAVLLVSEDATLGDGLGRAPGVNCLVVVRTSTASQAVERMAVVGPSVILLDLDLSADGGWQAAEWFLLDSNSVPILLLTGRTDNYELATAIQSGTVLDKALGLARLLQAVNSTLAASAHQRLARAVCQLAWLRRARPYRLPAGAAQPCQHWGINE
jgi:CheY-like chemotaxis protein